MKFALTTTGEHWRHCWDCQNIATHKDNVTPEVCCKKCGSQDTRAIRLKPCPFCGGDGSILQENAVSDGTPYFTVGCRTKDCLASCNSQVVGLTMDLVRKQVDKWNRRKAAVAS